MKESDPATMLGLVLAAGFVLLGFVVGAVFGWAVL